MNNETQIEQPRIDGCTIAEWASVLKTLTADTGWMITARMLSEEVDAANKTLFNSHEPERQLALHEAIGFLKFANMLSGIRDRAQKIVERGVSPDAAIHPDPA